MFFLANTLVIHLFPQTYRAFHPHPNITIVDNIKKNKDTLTKYSTNWPYSMWHELTTSKHNDRIHIERHNSDRRWNNM